MRDDDISVRRDLVHRRVDHPDVPTERAELLLQLIRADETRAHPGFAGEHDQMDIACVFDSHRNHHPSSSTPTDPDRGPVGVHVAREGRLCRSHAVTGALPGTGRVAVASPGSSSSAFEGTSRRSTDPTANETAAAAKTPRKTPRC